MAGQQLPWAHLVLLLVATPAPLAVLVALRQEQIPASLLLLQVAMG